MLTGVGGLSALLLIASLFLAYVWSPPEERSYDSPYLARVADRFVDTPTARFHYLQTGIGPPLVLIPGGTLWFYSYRKIIPALAHHYTVYAVDMPGQGYTEVSDTDFRYDLPAMSGALGSFLTRFACRAQPSPATRGVGRSRSTSPKEIPGGSAPWA